MDYGFILLLRIDPAAVIWDISINSWSVSDCTSIAPWGGANEIVSMFDWSTRVSLTSVFASCHNTGAEHTRQNGTSIGVRAVASWGWDCCYIDTLKSAWITGSRILNIIWGNFSIKKLCLQQYFPNRKCGRQHRPMAWKFVAGGLLRHRQGWKHCDGERQCRFAYFYRYNLDGWRMKWRF